MIGKADSTHGSQFFNMRQSINNFYFYGLKMAKKLAKMFLILKLLKYIKIVSFIYAHYL